MNLTPLEERQQALQSLLRGYVSDTVFIHSDLFRASLFVKPSVDKQKTLEGQINFLQTLLEGRNLWFPAFNYQFPKTKVFSAETSACEVGPLPEYFRQQKAHWRTLDPMFSASGTGENPTSTAPKATLTAFDNNSIFAKLVERKGTLLFYGAWFSATIIHYVEWLFTPAYRYDKLFSGNIVTEDGKYSVEYTYHVRPMGQHLDYDWDKLLTELQESGICRSLKNQIAFAMPAHQLVDFWLEKLKDNPFYFLDKESKQWVLPKLDQLGRRFQLTDFE